MTYPHRRQWGFTLIELMVTIAVALTFAILAVPSFQSLRQRSALRGAGDQMLSIWNQARFEAAKRNSNVKFAVVTSGGTAFCFGAATTQSTSGVTTSCNCFRTTACDVARFPANQAEWNSVTLASGASLTTPLVIDPRATGLTAGTTAGNAVLAAPALGNRSYRLKLSIDALGRGVLCEPSSATDKLSDYHARRC